MSSTNIGARKRMTRAFAAIHYDDEVLMKSSSGGAFTALSDIFLACGNAVACCRYNYSTDETEFSLICDTQSRDNACGSKYMQSYMGDIFSECFNWLKEHPEKELMFVGMGCQAAGFQRYIEAKELRNRVLVVDIICHGSPSPFLWKQYIRGLKEKHTAGLDMIAFRDKRKGWKRPTAYAKFKSEVSLRKYMKMFYSRHALRPSCYKCPFSTTERSTDLTIGDYWGIEKAIPEFSSRNGVSLILTHTDKGERVLDRLCKSMEIKESNVENCLQPNLIKPTERPAERERFWEEFYRFGAQFVVNKYGSNSILKRICKKIRKLLTKHIKNLER